MKTTQALCAKEIRKELKQFFPQIKFSVKSQGYSGGDSVRISWTNGPTEESVKTIVAKYQYGHFDGMTDMYEYTNMVDNMPQTKYLFCDREISNDITLQAASVIKECYADLDKIPAPKTFDDLGKSFEAFNQWYNWHQIVWKVTKEIDLTNAIGIIEDPEFESGTMFCGFQAITKEDN